jgi:hypothetical protein
MCGRSDNLIARDAYRGLFKAQRLPKSNFPLRYNVAPTDQIPIVRIDPRDGEREVVMARWGLVPFWMKEKPKPDTGEAITEARTPLRCSADSARDALGRPEDKHSQNTGYQEQNTQSEISSIHTSQRDGSNRVRKDPAPLLRRNTRQQWHWA